ncbi:Cys-tRNA(Pro) deacylase [Zymomonas mobilis]|uniref:Cys-tRNA(Pro)/Cys-tRNA(Cys) deacylase n=1 Tax=Zymomonas mobilis subsp. pomaceae (strain ATCC 29192 / DSM 22645 / JCM 10191 / CCUG 17912 / NBRC 13757 / NCIMB 11200 / NRRL B-4491 / Barker I) TaxID=579138 RepID=F8ETD2_ZYMMT|nr:Cys-tRNA(Pro) deacylase [Zymomonas mobilis]AEI37957.1 ybaK/ebsC protein [Zymomonas mobilis subsp. pomaceae ATCC 29192]MDX5949325.1 Cys-tRNA(Pro) deacylase [Zymomonas mobilis subsp. pomaceae]GEB89668.1 Cys-tRNA(Pro)/Cys-tRNA(Cys) deacylase [Zymomonas mobilis subsp. pomaceae]
MTKKTRGTVFLEKASIEFTVHPYEYDAKAQAAGLQAAEALNQPPEIVYKTLMAEVDGKPVCAVVQVHHEISMKKLAAAAGGKSAHMIKPADAERMTGYHVGGISPFGQKKRVPVIFDEAAFSAEKIFINGGQRGVLVALNPEEARRVVDGKIAAISDS